ncbi:2-dehydro-3-deoxy-D-gluconate 5-dehydrogenase KduD [Spirochaeta lutea]|uniref:2-dehydro-3-deoxy-D-gluconate 5-dehydrogenase n=1 Tax=Spirochaeta lutea TaxID=1480694 RepID=A0A098R239_9SPIO|nr:2-dehydro-3-deoxy-D-gluconate 5-dehydrogenase KduD [Spirochaeta lutea]KGE72777.1 2-deoxy-D-gluconate 3-dehydrogenase [Spirochaeta lutea]
MATILDQFSLEGKVALVTGSERGLGQGMALGLAEAGADILGVSYTPEAADTAAKVEALGRRYVHVQADLLSIEPIPGIIEAAKKAYGRIDILVNNAGIIKRNDSVNFTEAEWDDVMNINIKTVFFLCQAAARQFIAQGTGGKIINVASMLSFQGGIRVPSYTASKSGVKGITMLMANEWASQNINVNAIAPGYMATDNTAQLRADEKRSTEILDRIPAGRWGKPSDLAGAVVFLASAASDYINGYTIAVDGGWLAR